MDPAIAPASRASAVTPSDTTLVSARALYVGGAGDIAIVVRNGDNPVIFKSVLAGSIIPVHSRMVMATNTTATNIVALY